MAPQLAHARVAGAGQLGSSTRLVLSGLDKKSPPKRAWTWLVLIFKLEFYAPLDLSFVQLHLLGWVIELDL